MFIEQRPEAGTPLHTIPPNRPERAIKAWERAGAVETLALCLPIETTIGRSHLNQFSLLTKIVDVEYKDVYLF